MTAPDSSPNAFGWLRAPVPAPALPAPESKARRSTIHAIAVLALIVSIAYLAWRVTSTLEPGCVVGIGHAGPARDPCDARAGPVHVLVVGASTPPTAPRCRCDGFRIAVLVPTYNEGIEILLPTVAAAAAMRLAHETWVLDDGARPEVKRLARDLGVRYLARTEHSTPGGQPQQRRSRSSMRTSSQSSTRTMSRMPAFLVRTVGYFDDPRPGAGPDTTGVLQPRLVRARSGRGRRRAVPRAGAVLPNGPAGQEPLGRRVLVRNRRGAARRGPARRRRRRDRDTITEDIHTTIRLHRRGWRTVYHNEVLARGLAAADADTYQLQRLRRGTGAMQVLRLENPLLVRRPHVPPALSYAATLLGSFDAWRTLGFMILPIVVVVTGAVPVRADLVTFVSRSGLRSRCSRWPSGPSAAAATVRSSSIVFGLVRMTSNLRATLTLVTRQRPTFVVTPKGRQGEGRRRVRVPALLSALLAGAFLASAWFALTLLGRTPVTYTELAQWSRHSAGCCSASFSRGWPSIASVRCAMRRSDERACGSTSSKRRSWTTSPPRHVTCP